MGGWLAHGEGFWERSKYIARILRQRGGGGAAEHGKL